MAEQEQQKTFWTTVPGLLTGLASCITAVAGLLAIFIGKGGEARRSAQAQTQIISAPVAAPAAVQHDNPAQDAKACQRIAGQWWWSTGGVVSIGTDGSLQWRAHAGDAQPAVIGRWVCTDSQERQYVFSWSHGFSDAMALSEDGKRVSGVNQQTQTKIFGNRQQ